MNIPSSLLPMKPVSLLLLALGAVISAPPHSAAEGPVRIGADAAVRPGPVLEAFGRLPLRFERNDGQTDPQVSFLARGRGYGLFLTPSEVVLSLQGTKEARPAADELRERRADKRAEPWERSVLHEVRGCEREARDDGCG